MHCEYYSAEHVSVVRLHTEWRSTYRDTCLRVFLSCYGVHDVQEEEEEEEVEAGEDDEQFQDLDEL